MRSSVLRLASAALLALFAASAATTPATAFIGLSDKQADEINEFIKCKTFLLKGDLASFEADPDCGGETVFTTESLTYGISSGKTSDPEEEECYDWPDYPETELFTQIVRECYAY